MENVKTKDGSTTLTEKEFENLSKWFKDNCQIVEIINNKGRFNAYFPSREDLKKNWLRVGMNNIPHLTISKPSRWEGGFGITLYKKYRWGTSNFPDRRRAFKPDGTPKYATTEDVIKILEKNIIKGKWADDLNILIK